MKKPEFSSLIVELKEAHCDVVLNRPEKRNALNATLIDELHKCFDWLATVPELKVVALRGAGPAFCSGADLEYMKGLRDNSYNENLRDSKNLADLYLKILKFPRPVIAVVQGPAVAGGCGLAAVCDFILAGSEAKFGYPEVKIGFVAAMVSSFLVRQIGERKARDLLISGRLLDAEEALQAGLINKVCRQEDIEEEAAALSQKLQKNSPFAISKTKEILNDFRYAGIGGDMEKLAKLNAEYRQSDDFLEGVSAFLEKRKPKWNV